MTYELLSQNQTKPPSSLDVLAEMWWGRERAQSHEPLHINTA